MLYMQHVRIKKNIGGYSTVQMMTELSEKTGLAMLKPKQTTEFYC